MRRVMTARQKALKALQKLRRLQESHNGYCRCISCGAVDHYKNMDGGHYISRAERVTELEPENIWPQCKACNHHRSGNIVQYRMKLVERIGEERVVRLENMLASVHGSQDKFHLLCDEDKRKVVSSVTNEEYMAIAKRLNKEVRRLEKEL